MSDTPDTVDEHSSREKPIGPGDSGSDQPAPATPSAPVAAQQEPAPASPDTQSPSSELEGEVRQRFAQLDRFQLVQQSAAGESPQRYLGVGRLAQALEPKAHDELCLAIVGTLAERGYTVVPILLPPATWGELDARGAQERWLNCLRPDDGALQQLELLRAQTPHPRRLREWLLRLVRERAALIGTLRQQDFPAHATLQLCVGVAREALQLSFALAGSAFSDNARAIEKARELGERLPVAADDVGAYFALVGQLEGAQLLERLLGDAGTRHTRDPARALAWTERLLGRLERHARTALMTAEDRRRTRKRKLALGIAAAAALVAALVGYSIATAPRKPLADLSRISHPGGIRGSYYTGTNFDKFVFARSDARIQIGSTGAADNRIPLDRFSARWRGYLRFRRGGSHALCVESDDGARLIFDGEKIAGDWSRHPLKRSCAEVRVKPGWYPLTVEYYELLGQSTLRLLVGPDEKRLGSVKSADLCCQK